MFPSTEFANSRTKLASKVGRLVADRRRRVRRAALDLLACLGQLGLPGEILEAVNQELSGSPEKDLVVSAVRAR